MQAFSKVVRIGTQPRLGSLFCKIEFRDNGELSITGVEGPTRNGDCKGACGQIDVHAWDFDTYAPGWDAATVERFRAIWDAWHLNGMRAGSPAQRAYLAAHPITDRLNHFDAACTSLRDAGLHPDASYLHNGKPYLYGSAWLRDEVPADVLDWLRALPDADMTPTWV